MQNGITDKDLALLIARARDSQRIASNRNTPHFIGFLDEHQKAVVLSATKGQSETRTSVSGGYSDAVRTVVGWFPKDYPEEYEYFPIKALEIKWRKGADITHRDILGSVLSIGIERSTVGDILVKENSAVIFVTETVSTMVLDNLLKVGGEGVTVNEIDLSDISYEQQFEEISGTVASLRLDAILSMCVHVSREKASFKITSGYVSVNGMEVTKPSKEISPGDIISVRGTGRFRCEFPDGLSRKGRIRLTVSKFK